MTKEEMSDLEFINVNGKKGNIIRDVRYVGP